MSPVDIAVGIAKDAQENLDGLDVVSMEKRLRTLVDGFWPALEHVGLAGGASIDRLRFDPNIMRAEITTAVGR